MQLLTPHAFGDLFRDAGSAAFVGSASSILEQHNGPVIDACDVVVRFNRATTSKEVTERIGARTDLLCVTAENLAHFAEHPDELPEGVRCLLSFTSPDSIRRSAVTAPDHHELPVPVFATFGPDPFRLLDREGGRSRPLTTGTYSLLTLTRTLRLRKLFVTGFTMFGASGGDAGKYYQDPKSNFGVYHDLDREALVFASVLRRFNGELVMTDEVAHVVAQGQPDQRRQRKRQRQPGSSLTVRVLESLSRRLLRTGLRLRRAAELRARRC